MRLRPRPILAIAERELRQELAGRRWLSVPLLVVALMLPASTIRSSGRPTLLVRGDVPAEVKALPGAVLRDHPLSLTFDDSDPEQMRAEGPNLPTEVREVLDRTYPREAVLVERRSPPDQLPQRGLLLVLLSISGLTGSIASSVGTERSRHTLTTLLAAAVDPLEIVAGKVAAWSAFALVSTAAFMGVALARGVLEPGWWIVSVLASPFVMVSLGLWAVRRAPDVVSATTTALRVLPVATMVPGIFAQLVGDIDSRLGALVPIGGLLLCAGEVWTRNPAVDAALALVSSLVTVGVLMAWTARDLRDDRGDDTPRGIAAVPGPAALMGTLVFCTMAAPGLWRAAGNDQLGAPLALGAWTAAGCLLLVAAGSWLQEPVVTAPRRFRVASLPAMIVAVVGLLGVWPWLGGAADAGGLLGAVADGFHQALLPSVGLLPALALITAEEIVFRGQLAPRIGDGPAGAAWALAKAPLDPVGALLVGGSLAGIGRLGGPVATWLTRVAWWSSLTLTGGLG